jgi:peptidyl-prolyl cis-trans isomerase D
MILDLMRREKKKFLGILLLPLIFGLVAYLIPGVPGGVWGSGELSGSALAEVDGSEISTSEFLKIYRFRTRQFPSDRQFLKTLQLDRQILNQLVSTEVILAEARRLGLDATANEIQQRILTLPYFQDNGNFAFGRYQAILEQNGLTVQQFENDVREEIVQEKLKNLITDSVTVNDKELEEEYRNRNEKAKISYVVFDPSKFRDSVSLQEPEIQAHYEQNKESYRTTEQRKARYLFADAAALRNTVQIPDRELRAYYQQNLATYQLPERIRASHILLKTEGKSPEETEKIKANAAELLEQVKRGVDFAELAKRYSEDTVSAANGGDLGLFGRGAMVPEFDNAAFKLGPGAVSDLVKTQFGFHIIKVTEKQPARTQPFEEVEGLIRPTLLQRKADQMAQELADKAFTLTRNNKTLDQAAAELKLASEETPLFSPGAPIPGIGNSQEFSSKVFALKPQEIGSPVRVPNGFAVPQLTEVKAPYIPPLAEVRPKIEDALKSSKALELAKAKAQEFVEKAKSAKFEALAKSSALEVKSSQEFARNGNLPDLGSSSPFDEFAFSSAPGSISQPIQVGQKYVVAQLKEKKPVNPDEFAKAKEGLRESLLNPKKERIFEAYVGAVRERMTRSGKIKIDEAEFTSISRRL